MKKILNSVFIQRKFFSMLVLLVLLTIVALGSKHFRLDASADTLTLENDASLDFFRDIVQRFGGSDILVMAYKPKSEQLFTKKELTRLDEFVGKMEQVAGVASVISITNVPLLYSPKQSIEQLLAGTKTLMSAGVDLELAVNEFSLNPYYRGTMLSDDKKLAVVLLNLDSNQEFIALARERDSLRAKDTLTTVDKTRLSNLDSVLYQMNIDNAVKSKNRITDIENIIESYRDKAEIYLTGSGKIVLEMMAFIKSDLSSFGVAVLILVSILLWLIFRQWQFVVLPLVTCSFCIVAMVGLLGYLNWAVTVISANFIAMLFIINIVVCVHLLVRFRELLNKTKNLNDSVLLMNQQMLKPCLFNVITTMAAFSSLIISGIRPVIDFGLMMTIGVLVSLFICFVTISLGLVITKPKANPQSFKEWIRAKGLLPLVEKYYIKVWLVAATIAVLAIIGITKLEVENRFIDFFKADAYLVKAMKVIDNNLGGTMPFDIVLFPPQPTAESAEAGVAANAEYSADEAELFEDEADDLFGDTEATQEPSSYWWNISGLNEVEQFHDYLQSQPEIGKVISVATGYKIAKDLLEGVHLDDVTITVLRQELGVDLEKTLLKPYLNDEINATRVTMRIKESTPNLKRGELLERIENYAQQTMNWSPEQVKFTGLMHLYQNMLVSLFKSQILTISVVFLAILLIVSFLFRSFKIAIIAILPNILASGFILGLMGLLGISLDFMSITIAAITIGIGIDFAIHYIYRYRFELANGNDRLAAIAIAHGSIGQSLSYTTAIIAIGFSVFVLSNFIPSIYFGMLISLAMLISLFGTLTLLASLLLRFKIN